MRLAAPTVIALLAAAALAGCGNAGEKAPAGTATAPKAGVSKAPAGASARDCPARQRRARALRATSVSCGQARGLLRAWARRPACRLANGASRGSCRIRDYKCLSVRTGRGISVGCARPGRSVAFIARR